MEAGRESGLACPIRAAPPGTAGVNFALFSENAEGVELCLFDREGRELHRIRPPRIHDEIWHGYLPDVRPGQLYGYRVYGPYDPKRGHRFNPHKLLIDPYAKDLSGRPLDRRPFRLPHRHARKISPSTAATTPAGCPSAR